MGPHLLTPFPQTQMSSNKRVTFNLFNNTVIQPMEINYDSDMETICSADEKWSTGDVVAEPFEVVDISNSNELFIPQRTVSLKPLSVYKLFAKVLLH